MGISARLNHDPLPVSDRQLNRWTLARQLLLERVELDPVTAIERLACMQAQYSPSPYIGLWSRLRAFRREDLEEHVREDRVLKATLMRGTLHLVSSREFGRYRGAAFDPHRIYVQLLQQLRAGGIDTEAIRAEIVAALAERPLKRIEIRALVRHHLPEDLPDWAGWSTVAVPGDIINVADDARFGYFGGSRYRLAPAPVEDLDDPFRHVATAYLAAFGPATRADLAQWSGRTVAAFAPALETLELVELRVEDGRILLDLPDGPRSADDTSAPVRFLPKWDNLLLAYARRERVLPERWRRIVIRKNGDVLPTFLIDGLVAGTWEAPLRGRALMTLTPFDAIALADRRAVEEEGERLLTWLRPDSDQCELRWADR